jgi:hypothetical protein
MLLQDQLNQQQPSANPQPAAALPNQPQPLPPQPLNPQQPAIAQPSLVKANEVPVPTRGKLIYQQTWTLEQFKTANQLAGIDICPTTSGKWSFCDITKPIGQQVLGAVANSVPNKGYTAEHLRISYCADSQTGETMYLLHVVQAQMVSHQKLI